MSRHGTGTKFKTYETNGLSINIYVTAVGRFEALVGDRWLEKKNLSDLQTAIREAVQAQNQVQIPATLIKEWASEPPDFDDVVLVGYDTRRGAIYHDLDSEGKMEDRSQSSKYNQDGWHRRLTVEEREECTRLWQAKVDAEQALTQWQETRSIDPEAAVGTEMQKVLKQPPAEEIE